MSSKETKYYKRILLIVKQKNKFYYTQDDNFENSVHKWGFSLNG